MAKVWFVYMSGKYPWNIIRVGVEVSRVLYLFHPIFPTVNSVSVSAKSAVHGKPPAKESHKDLLSVLCFSMFLFMIYCISSKLSCLQIMQMITLFPIRI